jgi:hypothetical protein
MFVSASSRSASIESPTADWKLSITSSSSASARRGFGRIAPFGLGWLSTVSWRRLLAILSTRSLDASMRLANWRSSVRWNIKSDLSGSWAAWEVPASSDVVIVATNASKSDIIAALVAPSRAGVCVLDAMVSGGDDGKGLRSGLNKRAFMTFQKGVRDEGSERCCRLAG